MKTAALRCVVILLGLSIVPPVCASNRPASQLITEPGDPPAHYDAARHDWFVRQTTLAEPDGGTESRLSVTFLEDTQTLPVNGPDVSALGTWAQPLMDSLEKLCETLDLKEPLIMTVTLSPRGEPSFAVTPLQKLSPDTRQKITQIQMLNGQNPPRPRFVDCHLALVYHPKELKGSDDPGIPAALYPAWRESREYQAADLPRRIQMLRTWSRKHAVPLLAGTASQVDPKYGGVRAFGADILKLNTAVTLDVEKTTFRNPHFWRATIEMAPGDGTIIGCQVFLFVANGELGKASRLLKFTPSGADRERLASVLLAKLRGRIEGIETMTNERIKAGVMLFDQRQYDKAVVAFDKVLRDNPSSAWASHELLLSRFKMTGSNEVVKDFSAKVYGLDPLYSSPPIHVDTGEGFFQAFLRMSLGELFRDQSKAREDAQKCAQIALDLGEYGYAGLMYWSLLTRTQPLNNDLLRHFLYCTDRLGVTEIKALFKPEFSTGFDQIEQARRKRMEEHSTYQAIQKKK